MKLSKEQVEHIAKLARLNISEEEKKQYSGQLSAILDYVEKINGANTEKTEPTSQVTGLVDIMRPDAVRDSGIAEELVNDAPQSEKGNIKIPKVFENK